MTDFYKSKTFWGNIIAAASLFIGAQFGYQITEQETAVFFLALNAVLRAITKEPIEWT